MLYLISIISFIIGGALLNFKTPYTKYITINASDTEGWSEEKKAVIITILTATCDYIKGDIKESKYRYKNKKVFKAVSKAIYAIISDTKIIK